MARIEEDGCTCARCVAKECIRVEIDQRQLFALALGAEPTAALRTLEHIRNEFSRTEAKLYKVIWPGYDLMRHKIGYWACESSPLKKCVYDLYSDKYDDDCIFCHLPRERK